MAENVLKIKLEGDDSSSSSPVTPTPPRQDIRHNSALDDAFGMPTTTAPTDDMIADAKRRAILAAADAAKVATAVTGDAIAKQIDGVDFTKMMTEAVKDKNNRESQTQNFLSAVEAQRNAEDAQDVGNSLNALTGMRSRGGRRGLPKSVTGMGQAAEEGGTIAGLLKRGGGGIAGVVGGAGPVGAGVGAALVATEAIKAIIEKPFRMVREEIEAMGRAARQAAANDGIGALSTSANQAAEGLERIGFKPAAEAIKTATAAVQTFQATLTAFTDRGRELQGYDGRIAGAAAEADYRKVMMDINEANRMGERYARLIEAQSDLDSQLRELLIPIKEQIIDVLLVMAKGIETLTDWDKLTDMIAHAIVDAMAAADVFGVATEHLKKIHDQIDKAARDREAEKAKELAASGKELLNDLFAGLNTVSLTPPQPSPEMDRFDRELKFPAFVGLN